MVCFISYICSDGNGNIGCGVDFVWFIVNYWKFLNVLSYCYWYYFRNCVGNGCISCSDCDVVIISCGVIMYGW